MAFIPTVNAVRISVEGTLAGQVWVLTLQIGKGSAVSGADVQNAADGVQAWWDAEIAPALTTAVIANNVFAQDMSSATAPIVASASSPDDGTQSVPSLPNGTALVTTFRTSGTGRSSRGRSYLMGLANNSGTSVRAASGTQAAVLAAYEAMNSYLTAFSLFHAVVSKFTAGAPRASGLVQAVTAYSNDGIYDSQRRRLEGRGA